MTAETSSSGRPLGIANLTAQEEYLMRKLLATGVSEAQLISAKRYHREEKGRANAFSAVLTEFGFCGESEVAGWIAEHNKLRLLKSSELNPAPDVLRTLPQSIARARCAVPVSRGPDGLLVAIGDPEVPQFTQVRHALNGSKVTFAIAPMSDVLAAIDAAYVERFRLQSGNENELEVFVEALLKDAALGDASDIHVIPDEQAVFVKLRQDGVLQLRQVVEGALRERLAAAMKLSSKRGPDGRERLQAVGGLDTTIRYKPQGSSARRDYGSRHFSLRYSIIPTIYGERIVVRVLDQNAQVGELSALGMLEDHAAVYRRVARLPFGLVLNCGPTGQGKSTTLAAGVKYIDVHRKAVLTIEDPVEYRLRGVSQCAVLPEMGFAAALREFLRQNPDVILVGEIRDSETADIGISASQTGHLIFSTTHSNSAVGGWVRLIELGVDPAKLAFSSRLNLSQRLVRRLCPDCKRAHSEAGKWEERYKDLIGMASMGGLLPQGVQFCEAGGGCKTCRDSGFKGRIAIFELRPMRSEVRSLLGQATRGGSFDADAAERIYAKDFAAGDLLSRSMEQDGMLKAATGILSPDEVLAATVADI